jgi:hypothetical protein
MHALKEKFYRTTGLPNVVAAIMKMFMPIQPVVSYLEREVKTRATPLMEPNLSKVTELLMNNTIHDSPTVYEALIQKHTMIRTLHMATSLHA